LYIETERTMIRYFLLQIRIWVLICFACILAVSAAGFAVIQLTEGRTHAAEQPEHIAVKEAGTVISVATGSRMRDLIQGLERSGLTTEDAFLHALETDAPRLFPFPLPHGGDPGRYEGLFKPGAYRFEPGTLVYPEVGMLRQGVMAHNASIIVRRLLRAGTDRYASLADGSVEARESADSLVVALTPYEYCVLASIIEKEAVAGRQHRDVSAVFHRRLKNGISLGSCPTVEYALGYHRPFLTREDLSIESPYNVYIRTGLPPTPICFFSDQALDAALHPSDTAASFFVFDWTNERLLFSETYGEHLGKAYQAWRNYVSIHGREALRTRYRDNFYEP
jgi:cell division protein YceG involved in septum cleavage